MPSPTHIYTPESAHRGHFFRIWIGIVSNCWQHRDLILQLVRSELLSQFKRSALGVSWLVLNPLIVVLVWLFLNKSGVLNPGDTGIPYPAYVLLSISLWNFFEGLFVQLSKCLTMSGPIFTQTRFPHEVVIAQKVLVHLFNFSIPFVLNLVVLLIYDVSFTWQSLLFPIVLIPLFLFGASLGLIFSLVEVVAMDIHRAFEKFVHYLMYATPVVYASNIDSEIIQTIVRYNPLTYLLGGARDVLISGTLSDPELFGWCALGSILLFLLVFPVFVVAEPKVIERISQ